MELRRAMLLKSRDFFPDGEISRFPACLHIFAAGKRGFEIWRQSEMLIGQKKALPAWKVERIHSKESKQVKTNIKRTKCFSILFINPPELWQFMMFSLHFLGGGFKYVLFSSLGR